MQVKSGSSSFGFFYLPCTLSSLQAVLRALPRAGQCHRPRGFKVPFELSDLLKKSHSFPKIFQKKKSLPFSVTHPVVLKKSEDRDCFPYGLSNINRNFKKNCDT